MFSGISCAAGFILYNKVLENQPKLNILQKTCNYYVNKLIINCFIDYVFKLISIISLEIIIKFYQSKPS